MSKKQLLILAILLFSTLLLSLSLASAYTYYHPGHTYSYPKTTIAFPTYQESYKVFPKYENLPEITTSSSSNNHQALEYTKNYQGEIKEKTTTFLEDIKIGKSGRQSRVTSKVITERVIGPTYYETLGQESSNNQNEQYHLNPQNPSYYDSGSAYKIKDTYDFKTFGQDRYGSNYYYQPYYDSRLGYYRYRY